ncbi:MAG TPA: glycosyltransferase [Chitinophagales bacterium]|nr:glycosyltransferase [Chitinophagales bacterium]
MTHNDSTAPLVGIFMVSYNHENYIEQAIESVMMQQTDFTYKLFIAEDKSTDNTKAICERLVAKYPGKIDFVSNEKNLGSSKNVAALMDRVTKSGVKYVAILDGDDYWTDAHKLQMQVDVLEKDKQAAFCYTNVVKLNAKKGEFLPFEPLNVPGGKINMKQFVEEGAFIPTLTLCFRVSCFPQTMPDFFSNVIKQDWVICLMLVRNGYGVFLDTVTGAYRIHEGGVMHTRKAKLYANSLYMVENAMAYIAPEYQEVFGYIVSSHALSLAFAHLENREYDSFAKYLKQAIVAGGAKNFSWHWSVTKRFIRHFIPRK